MKYMLLIYADEQAWTEAERQDSYWRIHSTGAYASGQETVSGREPAAVGVDCHQRAGARRKPPGDGRSVRGDARTTRWLLPD